jgi:hypothetical protein
MARMIEGRFASIATQEGAGSWRGQLNWAQRISYVRLLLQMRRSILTFPKHCGASASLILYRFGARRTMGPTSVSKMWIALLA